ncbi:MAG: DUF4436 domain-containing protein [Mycobacteriaceae bacterium]|nr:DUF4436 domain-containing protein [Mycobacteriaceae bacterium]
MRFPVQDDMGELTYDLDKAPEPKDTAIEARGEPRNWPLDTYTIDPIRAEWLVGAGEDRHYEAAKIEVDGSADGFDIDVARVADSPNDVAITLKRTRAQRIFDVGMCLVLITLPAVALFVAIQMVTRRRPFLPPFGTWYAAMLFAVVPLRNFLPGLPANGRLDRPGPGDLGAAGPGRRHGGLHRRVVPRSRLSHCTDCCIDGSTHRTRCLRQQS